MGKSKEEKNQKSGAWNIILLVTDENHHPTKQEPVYDIDGCGFTSPVSDQLNELTFFEVMTDFSKDPYPEKDESHHPDHDTLPTVIQDLWSFLQVW